MFFLYKLFVKCARRPFLHFSFEGNILFRTRCYFGADLLEFKTVHVPFYRKHFPFLTWYFLTFRVKMFVRLISDSSALITRIFVHLLLLPFFPSILFFRGEKRKNKTKKKRIKLHQEKDDEFKMGHNWKWFLFPHLHSVDINKMVETFKRGRFDHKHRQRFGNWSHHKQTKWEQECLLHKTT